MRQLGVGHDAAQPRPPAELVAQQLQPLQDVVVLAVGAAADRTFVHVVGDDRRLADARQVVELHVAVRGREGVDLRVKRVDVDRGDAAPQFERLDRTDRIGGDDPERAERHLSGGEQVGVARRRHVARLAGGRDDTKAFDDAVQRLQRQAGAVGRGREQAGQRLRVDVRQVGERQTALGEQARCILQARAGAERDHARRLVVRNDPGERADVEHRAFARRQANETVAAADRPDRRRRFGDDFGDRRLVSCDRDRLRRRPLGSRPVAPFDASGGRGRRVGLIAGANEPSGGPVCVEASRNGDRRRRSEAESGAPRQSHQGGSVDMKAMIRR